MTEYVIFIVKYDPALVTSDFMAEHLWELEGVENIKIKEGD